jgi:hypothetical protein
MHYSVAVVDGQVPRVVVENGDQEIRLLAGGDLKISRKGRQKCSLRMRCSVAVVDGQVACVVVEYGDQEIRLLAKGTCDQQRTIVTNFGVYFFI